MSATTADFRELYVAELKAVGFSAADADEIAEWFYTSADMAKFPTHCRRVALAESGYDPAQPRNADGEWTAGGGARPREPETKPQHDRYGSTDEKKLTTNPKRNSERGMAAIKEVMRKQSGFVDKAMYRPEVGWIRFDFGWEGNPHPLKESDGKGHKKGDTYVGGHGLSHIAAKHKDDFHHLPEVIANGIAFRHPHDPTKTYFVHVNRFACVASLHKGAKKTITEYEPGSKVIDTIKKYPRAQAPGN